MSSTSLRSQLAKPWAHERSLTVVLIFLLINVVLIYPLSVAGITGHLVFGIGFGLVLVSGVAATTRNTVVLVAFTVVAVISVVAHWVRYVNPTPPMQLADLCASLVSSALLTVILLVQVFREGEVTSARVQGAVAVYLLLAMTWAFAYAVIATLDVNAFQETVTVNPTEVDTHRYMYFSFVTLTTLGLTDILPMSPIGPAAGHPRVDRRPALPGHPHRPPGVARALLPAASLRARAGLARSQGADPRDRPRARGAAQRKKKIAAKDAKFAKYHRLAILASLRRHNAEAACEFQQASAVVVGVGAEAGSGRRCAGASGAKGCTCSSPAARRSDWRRSSPRSRQQADAPPR